MKSQVSSLHLLGAVAACLLGLTRTAHAQPSDNAGAAAAAPPEGAGDADESDAVEATPKPAPPAPVPPATEAKGQLDARAAAVTAEPPPAPADDQLEQYNGFVRPQPSSVMTWHGSLEADGGYARYSFERDEARPQAFYDARGRFVVGPTLDYRFGQNKAWFVAARGELVAWLRENNAYQINADDVYAQVGLKGVWDFKFGRFRTWRVYHKGGGFDLYTLEDLGACRISTAVTGSCSIETGPGAFGPHTYEVNHLYDREPAGHAAMHVYPTSWSGFEIAGGVGNNGANNVLAGRGAALVHFDYFRISAAAEYRSTKPAQEKSYTDPNTNAVVECANCGVSNAYGFGGSAELTLTVLQAGVNVAQSHETQYTPANGTLDKDATNTRTSLGGYAQVDLGRLAFHRSLWLGFGLNRSEVVDEIQNFEQHYQSAGYIAFPLGFNAASLKLVVSQATLDIQSAKSANMAEQLPLSTMRAARLRLTYPF